MPFAYIFCFHRLVQEIITYQYFFWFLSDERDANTFAIFATGTDCIYEELKEIKLELNHYNAIEVSPIANTCTATVVFPVSYKDYSSFKSHIMKIFAEAMNYFGMM